MSAESRAPNKDLEQEFNFKHTATETFGPKDLLIYNIKLSVDVKADEMAIQKKDTVNAFNICTAFLSKIAEFFKRTESENNSFENVSLSEIAFADEAASNELVNQGQALIHHEFRCNFTNLVFDNKDSTPGNLEIDLAVQRFLAISEEQKAGLEVRVDQFESQLMAALLCNPVSEQ